MQNCYFRVALQEALDENEKFRKVIEDLKEENALIKQMLDEANSFVEVIKVCLRCLVVHTGNCLALTPYYF